MMIHEMKLLEELRDLDQNVSNGNDGLDMSHMEIFCDLRNFIRNAQFLDED